MNKVSEILKNYEDLGYNAAFSYTGWKVDFYGAHIGSKGVYSVDRPKTESDREQYQLNSQATIDCIQADIEKKRSSLPSDDFKKDLPSVFNTSQVEGFLSQFPCRTVFSQVVGQDHTAWNLHCKAVYVEKMKAVVFSMDHPELKTLPTREEIEFILKARAERGESWTEEVNI